MTAAVVKFPTLEELIRGLFRINGPLFGKSQLHYPIADVDPVGKTLFVLKDFLKGQSNLEEVMKLAAIKIIGWPSPSPGDFKADMVYPQLGLVLECDETQHYDPTHMFHNNKPFNEFQNPRDRRINQYYVNKGYTVIRLRACYREIHTYIKGKNKGKTVVQWTSFALREITQFTIKAIELALAARKDALARGDVLRGSLMIYPETSRQDTLTEKSALFLGSGSLPMPNYGYETIFARAQVMTDTAPVIRSTMEIFDLNTQKALEQAVKFLADQPTVRQQIRKIRGYDETKTRRDENDSSILEEEPDAKKPRFESTVTIINMEAANGGSYPRHLNQKALKLYASGGPVYLRKGCSFTQWILTITIGLVLGSMILLIILLVVFR